MSREVQMKTEEPYIQRTWQYYPGTKTVILSLPRQLAKKYHIEEHTNLIISDTGSGILVRKLEVPSA